MKWKVIYKRAAAFALGVLMLANPAQMFLPWGQTAQAAENRVEFKEQIGEGKYEYNVNTQIVAGYNVEMRTELPDYVGKWNYTNPPYGFFRTGAPLSGVSANLVGSSGNPQRISVNTPLADEGGTDWLSYTVIPKMQVNMTVGLGEFVYEKVVDSGPAQTERISVNVTSASGLAIIEPSSITFETRAGQTATGLTFEKVSVATGPWAGIYQGKDVLVRNQSGNSFDIIVGSDLVLKIDSPMPIPPGAKFTITYTFGKMPELTLTAVTPQRAISDVEINMEKLTEPSKTGEKLPFIQFTNASDYQYGVTGSFHLLNEFYKYNAPMKIDWALKNAADAPYVKILPQQGKNQIIAQVNSSLSPNDHEVILVATIGFRSGAAASESKSIEIPIVIQGSGMRPKVEITKIYNGRFEDGAQEIEEAPANNIFPRQMEVDDGHRPHVASLDQQRAFPPFKVQAEMRFGVSQGRATHAVVSTSAESVGKVKFFQDAQNIGTTLTPQGVKVDNLTTNVALEQLTLAHFVGEAAGNVSIKIEYFNGANAISPAFLYHVEVQDHSPSSDASLKELGLTGIVDPNATDEQKEAFRETYVPNGKIEYGFDSKTLAYTIAVPDVVNQVTLRPIYNFLSIYGVNQDAKILVNGVDGLIPPVPSSGTSVPIDLAKEGTTVIEIATVSEDGTPLTYKISISRSSQSIDSTLKDIVVTQLNADRTPVTVTPKFSTGTLRYTAEVPYSVDKVNVKAVASGLWGSRPTITSDGPLRNLFARIFENASNKDILLTYDDSDINNIKNITNVTIEVKAEDPNAPSTKYVVAITRKHPSDDRELKSIKLLRDKEMTEVKLDGKAFSKEQRVLSATIPYSTTSLRLELQPNHDASEKIRVEASAGNNRTQTRNYINKGTPLIFDFSGLAQGSIPDAALDLITFTIWVTAESGRETDPPYVLTVERSPAETDTRLTTLTVVDEADNKPVAGFSFSPTKRSYEFSVPYTTEGVIVTPVAKSALSKVYVDGKLITTNVPSRTVKLPLGVTTISVLVIPESGVGSQDSYELKISRTQPSKEARLSNLVVNGGQDQKPTPFVPATTSYSWSIPEGTRNFTITATGVDPLATITVNGDAAPNGGPSNPIVTTQANNTIQVVVTAQDGITKKTYTIRITDYNFIKRSDNANLIGISTNYGQLAPKFNPTVDEYEVYVKPTAMSMGITPRPANSKAVLEVKAGSRIVSEYNGVYTASMLEDELTFTIKVTSEDGKNQKTYTLYVYRNDEEKEGIFKPITADLVDFESSDPIIIDISTYPVVEAEVFNTMKTEYADKTVLFKGIDYTLEMKGSDLDTLVPHTASYDLSFSFTTPDQLAIEDVLHDMDTRNNRLDPVYLYFDHHGALPAPMRLTVSLGKAYSNSTLYWNYYNPERERIDYYGYVNSNAKGTFSVPIDHFSTYLVTITKVSGAENKSGLDYASSPWLEELGAEDVPQIKYNPETGVKMPR